MNTAPNQCTIKNSNLFSVQNNVFLLVNPDIYDVDFVPFLTEEWLGRRSVSAEEVVKFFYTYPRYSGDKFQ